MAWTTSSDFGRTRQSSSRDRSPPCRCVDPARAGWTEGAALPADSLSGATAARGFVPAPSLVVDEAQVLCDEPLTRGWGQAHVLQYAYRVGGELVYVSHRYPHGLTQPQFDAPPLAQREAYWWDELVRDPDVYAKGTVRHPDHATIHLWGRHRVHMNTEAGSRAMRRVASLD